MNSRVSIETIDEVVISYATSGKLQDEDLARIVSSCNASIVRKYLSIAVGDISVTAMQRSEARKLSRVQLVAVIDSPVMRGVVTALSWFGIKVSSFAPSQIDAAIAKLDVSREHGARIKAAVMRLEREANPLFEIRA